MSKLVQFEKQSNPIGILRIHRPKVRNALSWAAMEQFAAVVQTAGEDPEMRVLIVTGGPDSFCAGGDLVELHRYPSREDGQRLSSLMGEALNSLARLPFPTIAAIEGPAMGGGAEIALACDLRVIAEGIKFGLMHIHLGIATAWGGGPRLAKLVGYSRALEWQTRGVVLNGYEAFSHGLANLLVPDGEALSRAQALAGEIAAHDPHAVRAIKRILTTTVREGVEQAAKVERQLFPSLWSGVAHLEAADTFINNRSRKR